MFTNLIFLVLILLLINTSLEMAQPWIISAPFAFAIGMGAYALLLLLLYWQARQGHHFRPFLRNQLYFLVQLELLLFLVLFHFGLGAQRVFFEANVLGHLQIIPTLFSLGLYLGGLSIYHFFSFDATRLLPNAHVNRSIDYTLFQLRLMLPFVLPFLLFTLAVDILTTFPQASTWIGDYASNPLVVLGSLIVFALVIIIFLPYFIQKIWQCRPLDDREMEIKLELLCKKADFKHAGIKTWTVLNDSLTAAIVGVVAPFRYIIFTKRILREFPQENLEAILAHEIGHSYHKHLWIYPGILFGMMIFISLVGIVFINPFLSFISLQSYYYPDYVGAIALPIITFALYAALLALYFRGVFGFYSRLFERQADLHVFHVGVPAQDMIRALDLVGINTGYSHRVPNWHHYSIQERIDFLTQCLQDPQAIQRHHRRVKVAVLSYFACLAIACAFLLAPYYSQVWPLNAFNQGLESTYHENDHFWNDNLRTQIVGDYFKQNPLKDDSARIRQAFFESLSLHDHYEPGETEATAAQMLLDQGDRNGAAAMMALAWQKLPDRERTTQKAEKFNHLFNQIIRNSSSPSSDPKGL